MQIILKITLLLLLLAVGYQDLKERKVFLWVLITLGGVLGYLHFKEVGRNQFLIYISINILIVFFIILIVSIYSKYKLRKELRQSIGYGDLLFFFIIAIGFPNFTFLILFIFSIFFTGIAFFLVKIINKKYGYEILTTANPLVPLAGFQALFIAFVFLVNWSLKIVNLYTL